VNVHHDFASERTAFINNRQPPRHRLWVLRWLIGVIGIALTAMLFGIFLGLMSVVIFPAFATAAPNLFAEGPPAFAQIVFSRVRTAPEAETPAWLDLAVAVWSRLPRWGLPEPSTAVWPNPALGTFASQLILGPYRQQLAAFLKPFRPYNLMWLLEQPSVWSAFEEVTGSSPELALQQLQSKRHDPDVWMTVGEMDNALLTAQLAVRSLIDLCSNYEFTVGNDTGNAALMRKTIAAQAIVASVEKALEAVGGAGFFRAAGIERLLRDVHGAQFHALPAKRQLRLTGRIAFGLDPTESRADVSDSSTSRTPPRTV
jgi:hypothetical protein